MREPTIPQNLRERNKSFEIILGKFGTQTEKQKYNAARKLHLAFV